MIVSHGHGIFTYDLAASLRGLPSELRQDLCALCLGLSARELHLDHLAVDLSIHSHIYDHNSKLVIQLCICIYVYIYAHVCVFYSMMILFAVLDSPGLLAVSAVRLEESTPAEKPSDSGALLRS